jgi:hypothetical protein
MTVLSILVAAAVMAAPLGTEFTYQGVLSDAGAPATGDFDFSFLLYDADVGGSQVGIIIYVEDLTVTDGDDDTLADLSCASDEIARWNGTAWNCSSDDDTPYARTFVVGPVGTPAQNGMELRNAVFAFTPPTSQEEAVLLKLEPGVYDTGTTALPIWGWMTIEGAGQDLTVITGTVCDSISGTVNSWSDHSGLRRLTRDLHLLRPGPEQLRRHSLR